MPLKHTEKFKEDLRKRMKGNQINKGKKHVLGKHWKIKDTSKMSHPAWNKGLHTNLNPQGGFKKGIKPWNSGKKGVQVAWNKGKKNLNWETKKNPNWKGGITPLNLKIRHSLEAKLWKRSCLERDNFICQKTGQRGGDLVVHHINNFDDFPELRTSIENGITLSQKAHKEFHKKYGIKNNSREQLIEFLNK